VVEDCGRVPRTVQDAGFIEAIAMVSDGIDDGSQGSDSKSAGEDKYIMTAEFFDGPR
jgi:hypothetical protein